MHVLPALVLLWATCCSIHVEATLNITCYQCHDCPATNNLTEVGSCTVEEGFCVTRATSDGKTDRECGAGDAYLEFPEARCREGTWIRTEHGQRTEMKVKNCRCDEHHCNSNALHVQAASNGTTVQGAGNHGEGPSLPWWGALLITLAATLLLVLICACVILGPSCCPPWCQACCLACRLMSMSGV